jgi:hypothetical protein
VTGFLSELGKQAAERWLALLVVPGVLFLSLSWATWIMSRHGTLFDPEPVTTEVERWADRAPATLAVAAAAVLVGAAGAALLAQGIGALVERCWFAPDLGPPGRGLTARRQRNWQKKDNAYWTAVAARRQGRPGTDPDTALAARNRICLVTPARPTWMADRVNAAAERVHLAYHLDLSSLWPRLWLTLPDPARTELAGARTALARDARTVAWGLLYLAPALWWWPAVAIAAATCAVAWWRARSSTDVLAELAESAVDLHAAEVAEKLRVAAPDGITPDVGDEITERIRKDG